MGKLHELLAVEGDLETRAGEALKQIKELFGNPQKLLGQVRRYRPLEEDGKGQPDEITNLSTTVEQEVARLFAAWGAWVDASIQKEVTNQKTSAEVKLGKEAFSLPAPALLNLEKKLAGLRSVIEAIPTNDTTERWEWDAEGESYVSAPRVTFRTEKVPKAIVLYDATKEHPAQVQAYTEDVRVGEWTTTIRSGMLSPSRKREVLSNLDQTIAAVKRARQQANDVEVDKVALGEALRKAVWGS